jgi:hypothetical protein
MDFVARVILKISLNDASVYEPNRHDVIRFIKCCELIELNQRMMSLV